MAADPAPGRATAWVAALRRFGPLIIVAIVVILLVSSGAAGHLSLRDLGARRQALEALVRTHPAWSLAAYVGLYALLVGCSIPAALVMTLAGGMLFGIWVGGAAASLGCTAGATMIYLICRTALGDALKRRAGHRVDRIVAGVRRNAFSYVMMLRLVPIAPFWLANLALSAVDIPLRTYVVASFIGIAPACFIYAGLGAQLDALFARGLTPDTHILMQPRFLATLTALGVLAAAPLAAKLWMNRSRG